MFQEVFIFLQWGAVCGLVLCLGALGIIGCSRFLGPTLAWFFRRIGVQGAGVFVFMAMVCAVEAQKTTNSCHGTTGGSPLARSVVMRGVDTRMDYGPVTNLSVVSFRKVGDQVDFVVAWPPQQKISDFIELYVTTNLSSREWAQVDLLDVEYARSNYVGRVQWHEYFPGILDLPSGFMTFSWYHDADGDGLTDGEELYLYHTDPERCDTDGDGLNDTEEILGVGSDPLNPDTDGDGFPDGWDAQYFNAVERNDDILNVDSDNDGLTNLEESFWGTDPRYRDTDGDGLWDGWEVLHGFDPLSEEECDGALGDPDYDGFDNLDEFYTGTDPLCPDSDGDGLIDGLDARPLIYDGDFSGQSGGWVRANFDNAQEILSAGYVNWVDAQVGVGLANGLYKFVVTIPDDLQERSMIKVGAQSVMTDSAGDYVFLLRKGIDYSFGVYPYSEAVTYSWTDDLGPDGSDSRVAARSGRSNLVPGAYALVEARLDAVNEEEVRYPLPDFPTGRIFIDGSFSISPETQHVNGWQQPVSFMLLSSDFYQAVNPTVIWRTEDGHQIGTGPSLILYDGLGEIREIDVDVSYGGHHRAGRVTVRVMADHAALALRGSGQMVFEDAYTNSPTEIVEASSTRIEVNVDCFATRRGQVELSLDSSASLAITDEAGHVITLPCTRVVGEYESLSEKYFVELLDGNATGNIGSLALSYTSDDGQESESRVLSLQAYKIKVEADATWPANRVRHVFGPGERFKVIVTPGEEVHARAAQDRGIWSVGVNCGVEEHLVSYRVVHPTGARREFVRAMTDADWSDRGLLAPAQGVVGVGLVTKLFLEPSYVSFSQLDVEEGVAHMSNRQGCFVDETSYPDNEYGHGITNGGDTILNVHDENQVGDFDSAGCQMGVPPSSSGSFDLLIPLRWGLHNQSCTHFIRFSRQNFFVTADGEATLTKDGLSATRSPYD